MYNEFYSFSENPFNVTPDPKFLFLTASHREALASMVYGINQRKGFISITGEVGTGKTTLIHHLLQTLDPQIKAVFIYQTHITFEDLLRNVLLELELKPGDQNRAALMRQLNDYLIQKLALDENLVLFIDEAQNLSREMLEDIRMLSNLETANFKLVQIIFVGQPEFEEKLNTPELRQLKQRVGIRREILPLADSESRQYIDHRLKLVGSGSSLVFTEEALAFVIRYAEGVPRTINMVCDNAFLIGFSASKKRIDETIIREVLTDMGILETKKAIHRPQPKDPGPKPTPPPIADPRQPLEKKSLTVDRGPSTADDSADRGPAGIGHDSWTDNKELKGLIPDYSSPGTASVDRRPAAGGRRSQMEPSLSSLDSRSEALPIEMKGPPLKSRAGDSKAKEDDAVGPKGMAGQDYTPNVDLQSLLSAPIPDAMNKGSRTPSISISQPENQDIETRGPDPKGMNRDDERGAGDLGPATFGTERYSTEENPRKFIRWGLILLLLLIAGVIAVFWGKDYGKRNTLAEKPQLHPLPPVTAPTQPSAKTPADAQPDQAPEVAAKVTPEKDKSSPDPFQPAASGTKTSGSKPVPPPEGRLNKIVVVQKGDTIYAIARKHFSKTNLSIIDHILMTNPKITNPNLIRVNQRIRIPDITADSLIIGSAGEGYRIHLGTFAGSGMIEQYRDEPKLGGKTLETIVHPVSPEETWYKAFGGNFATKEEALQVIKALKEKGLIPALTGKKDA